MAKQSGSDFATYVKNIFKRTDKDTELFEAATDVLIDMRLRLLSEDFKEEAYTTGIATLGEYRLGVPSDYGHLLGDIIGLDDSNDTWVITKISKEYYDMLYSSRLHTDYGDMDSGRPVHYAIFAKQIYLGPVPDDITYQYQINYTTEPETAIVSGTSEVDFTDRHREIVRAGVLMHLHRGLENFPEADRWELEYEKGLQKIQDNDDFNTMSTESMLYNGI